MSEENETQWKPDERRDVESRILCLRLDQIGALLNLCGLKFKPSDIPGVVDEVISNGHRSIHLDILMSETKSKDDLLWWLEYFEKGS